MIGTSIADDIHACLVDLPISRAAIKKFDDSQNGLNDEKRVSECPDEIPRSVEKDEPSMINLNYNLTGEDSFYFFEDKTPSKDSEDQRVPSAHYRSKYATPHSPITVLMEYSQKNRNTSPFVWNEFSENGLFGCRIQWGDKFWVAPAEYSRKKEARTIVAIMACIEIFDDCFIFENVNIDSSDDYKSWTKDSVRKMSDEYERKRLATSEKNSDSDKVLKSSANISSKSELPANVVASNDPSSSERPFVAIVNEMCQKLRIPLPEYECFSEKCGSIQKFRCSVSNLSGFPDFRSNAMSSKREAKNEIANQIYDCLKNSKDTNSSLIKSQNINVTDLRVGDIISGSPVDIKSLIPMAMTLLTHLSSNCYPEMNTREGILKIVDEWSSFLEWKKQKE